MTLTVFPDLVQGCEEWLDARRGLVTASTVGQLLTMRRLTAIEFSCPACGTSELDPCCSKRTQEPIKTMHPERVDYAREQNVTVLEPAENDYSRSLTLLLAAERITGWTDPHYVSDDMLRGIDCEPIARDLYSEKYSPVTEVGFMVLEHDEFRLGYSPDGLVGSDGLIEVKSPRAKNHLATILADEPPADYMPQLQAGLLVSGRDWVDFVSYVGGMPLFVKRVYPDQQWFAVITKAATSFEQTVTDMIRQYDNSAAEMYMTERVIEQEMVI